MDFFKALTKLLPCENCRINYNKHISEIPIDVSSSIALREWITIFSDKVNSDLEKQLHDHEKTFKELDELKIDTPDPPQQPAPLPRQQPAPLPRQVYNPSIKSRPLHRGSSKRPNTNVRIQVDPKKVMERKPCNCGSKKR